MFPDKMRFNCVLAFLALPTLYSWGVAKLLGMWFTERLNFIEILHVIIEDYQLSPNVKLK